MPRKKLVPDPEVPRIALLPCPWCGSENVRLDDSNLQQERVKCYTCMARGPMAPDPAAAYFSWNKGPYADRFEIHSSALRTVAAKLNAEAEALRAKAAELEQKAKAASA